MPRSKAEPSSPELVREAIARIKAARLSGGAISSEQQKLIQAEHQADEEVRVERAGRLTGDKGAAEREQAAIERRTKLRMRLVELGSDSEAVVTLIREQQGLIDLTRKRDPLAFFAEIEATTPALEEARDKLVPVLEAYRAQWLAQEGDWTTLASTVRHHTESRENTRGVLRDTSVVSRDSRPRPCPISAKLIDEVRAATPRPPALSESYYTEIGGAIERAMAADD